MALQMNLRKTDLRRMEKFKVNRIDEKVAMIYTPI